MKKLCILLMITALVSAMPVTALAEEEPPDTEPAVTTSLEIDNTHVFAGMDKAYKDGYTPTVKDGKAIIVLPLVASGEIGGNTVTATPGLGDTSSSPFVYSNYEKTVSLNDNSVSGGGTVSSYLVRFDLALSSERYNGVYPVTIDVQAQAADGSPIQQPFTTYVIITDGKDPNAAEPTPEPEKPVAPPKIIVRSYTINPSPVAAGGEFTVTITLENTSETESVKNMAATISCDSANFSLQNDSNVIYIGKLKRGKTTDIALTYKTDLETPAQRYNIMLAIEYDSNDITMLSSSGTVPVAVSQPLRMEIEIPEIPESVNAGDTMPLSFQVMNMGRGPVYNVRVELSAPGLIPSETAFIGNMEAGIAMPGEMDVFIGTKNMSEGYTGDEKYGRTSGTITLIYEDAEGTEYTLETELSTTIEAPVIISSVEEEEEPEKASQWWISIVIGGVIAAGLAAYIIIRKKRERKNHEDI